MKILFVVTGVGFGDSIRVNAILEEFRKDDKNNKFMVAGYDNSYKFFKKLHPTINIRGYKIPGKNMKFKAAPFIFKNLFLPFVWFISAYKIKKAVKRFNPDIILSDFEPTGALFANLIKKKCVMIFGFDPLMYKRYKSKHRVSKIMQLQAKYLEGVYNRGDYTIIPTLLGHKKGSLIFNYVNPITKLKPLDLPSIEKLMKKLKLKKRPVLLMLGGSDFGKSLLKKVDKCARNFPAEKFIVFGARKLRSSKLEHHNFKDNFLEYIKVSKAVISLGGKSSLSEIVIFKKPSLIYPIQDHIEQTLNAYELRKYALIRNSLKNVEADLRKLLKNINSYQKKMDSLKIKADGAKEIVNVVKIFSKSGPGRI
ncbi:MAG: glycosyltransferase family protein [Nanoarchaeota archaeon]|nr:glycosyltransferase family protein [Nanoarchaeota archaeon]